MLHPQHMLKAVNKRCWLCVIDILCSEVQTSLFTRVIRDTQITEVFSDHIADFYLGYF